MLARVEDPPPLVTPPRGVDTGRKHLDALLAQRLGRQVSQVLGADLDDVDKSLLHCLLDVEVSNRDVFGAIRDYFVAGSRDGTFVVTQHADGIAPFQPPSK